MCQLFISLSLSLRSRIKAISPPSQIHSISWRTIKAWPRRKTPNTCTMRCSRRERHLVRGFLFFFFLTASLLLTSKHMKGKVTRTSKRALIHDVIHCTLTVDELISQGVRRALLRALNFFRSVSLQAVRLNTHTRTLTNTYSNGTCFSARGAQVGGKKKKKRTG